MHTESTFFAPLPPLPSAAALGFEDQLECSNFWPSNSLSADASRTDEAAQPLVAVWQSLASFDDLVRSVTEKHFSEMQHEENRL
jgi:hypothetical protein